jgi:hypothetical protein
VLREHRLRAGAFGLLLAFLAAPLSFLGLGLHIASDRDHEATLIASLARIATHGHNHDAATVAHDHPTLRPDGPKAPRPASESAPELAAAASPALGAPAPGFALMPAPTGSPPLFRRHCALLL